MISNLMNTIKIFYSLLKCKDSIYKRKKHLNKNYNLDNRTIIIFR